MKQDTELPVVALVGAPNAGKSTLLNKIAGEHLAVTSETAGTTRDRQYAEISWNGKQFLLVDTAGLDFSNKTDLESSIQSQVDIALAEADLLIFVADYKNGPEGIDRNVLLKIRKNKLTKILAINKVDSPRAFVTATAEFAKWGIKPSAPVSALTGRGVGDLLDLVSEKLPSTKVKTENFESIKIALIGKPNVGKSSLINSWLKDNRMVVSPTPGTTRTTIDTKFSASGQNFTLLDTAGLKKKARRQEEPDVFSGFQTYRSIRKSDVCFLVIDATLEITSQDLALAREITDQEKGCIILVNKMDIFKGSKEKLHAYISEHIPHLWMCPVFFVSAETGETPEDLWKLAVGIYERRNKIIEQETLNKLLSEKLKKDPPRQLLDQKKPKVYNLKQIGTNPPSFEVYVNHPRAFAESFRRSLAKKIIKDLDFWGTPVRVHLVRKVDGEKENKKS